jgi:hypothetical protein
VSDGAKQNRFIPPAKKKTPGSRGAEIKRQRILPEATEKDSNL